jgi:hypothetical protein
MKTNTRLNLRLFALITILTVIKVIAPNGPVRWDGFDSSSISGDETHWPLNDSMPHYQYKRIEDSVKKSLEPMEPKPHTSGTGSSAFKLGFYEYDHDLHGETGNKKEYYISLSTYRPKVDAEFFRRNGENVIRKVIWDNTWKDSEGKHASGHWEIRKTPVKYIEENKENGTGSVQIPISKRAFSFWNITLLVLGALFGIFIFLYTTVAIFKFLLAIASGDPFNETNIRRLRNVAKLYFTVAVLMPFIQLTFYLIYRTQIPDELRFAWLPVLTSSIWPIVGGLVALLFANAFQQGYELKKERDLTI